ncbi:MAG: tRNA (guanosine(46)-N7)-methyltransferase TrmB [Bdellovibrionia bacterium]
MRLTERSPDHFNKYAVMADHDYVDWVFTERRAMDSKGLWRSNVFKVAEETPVDLEIGVGNGYFFEHLCAMNPERRQLGIEIKFKQLIQTTKRTLKRGCENGRLVRFDAGELEQIFGPAELNDVYIFFPDPWPKKRHHKNRLITYNFLMTLFELQRPGSCVQFKTDSREYFDWIMERVPKTPYVIEAKSDDLHVSGLAQDNFRTHFENLWTGKGLKTNYLLLRKS